MAIPAINVLGNPNVTEGNFQIAIEDLRKSVIGSGKVYDAANTYSQYDTCVYGGVVYYSKINSNTGNTPAVGTNWGLIGDLITGVVHNVGNETVAGVKTFSSSPVVPNATTATQAIAYGQAVKLTGNESIGGIKTFTTSPIVPTPTTTGNIITMGNILEKTAVGIGYGSGSGGTVTQLTSKSTAVTLNKPTGQIIMNNSALAAGATVGFTLINSLITTTDTIIVKCYNFINYRIDVRNIGSGACTVNVTSLSAGSLSEAIVLNFAVIKGANA